MKKIFKQLALKTPIIAAPLALYPVQNRLVAKVSNAGGLGVYSSYEQTLEKIISDIANIKLRTDRSFAVAINIESVSEQRKSGNLDLADISRMKPLLSSAYLDLSIADKPAEISIATNNDLFKALLDIDNRPAAIVFQNGLPSDKTINDFKSNNIICFAVASNLLEAMAIEHSPIDGIILQGLETAGLLSQFDNDLVEKNSFYPISTLINALFSDRNLFNKPIITWGNYLSPEQTKHVLAKCDADDGIAGVMLDTAFWTCSDIGIPGSYMESLQQASEMSSSLSTAFTGHVCRVLSNKLTQKVGNNHLSMRKQFNMLQPIIEKSIHDNNQNYMPMWAGCRNYISNFSVLS